MKPQELITAMSELKDKQLVQLSIHHTMGFNFKTLQALLTLADGKGLSGFTTTFPFAHLQFAERMTKNYCGAPKLRAIRAVFAVTWSSAKYRC
jgi:hypothetical protein